jgi:chromosome segregation ATPase
MSAFMAQMRETLGGQLGDLSGLMQQSAQSMSQVEVAMRSLVTDMQKASSESTSGMQSAVRDLIESLTQHQQQSEALSGSTAGLLERVEATMARVAQQNDAVAQRTQASITAVAGAMDARVAALAAANEQSAEATTRAIAALGSISNEAITGMSRGAAAVASAVGAVQQAAERLARLTEQMGAAQSALLQTTQQLTQRSGVLGAASQSLTTATTSIGNTTSRFEAIAQVTRTEADIRAQLLNDLRALTEQSRTTGQALATLRTKCKDTLRPTSNRLAPAYQGAFAASHGLPEAAWRRDQHAEVCPRRAGRSRSRFEALTVIGPLMRRAARQIGRREAFLDLLCRSHDRDDDAVFGRNGRDHGGDYEKFNKRR